MIHLLTLNDEEHSEFAQIAQAYAAIPAQLRDPSLRSAASLNKFKQKLTEILSLRPTAISIGPFLFDESHLEQTPNGSVPHQPGRSLTLASETLLLAANLLGEVFTYVSMKQSGKMIQHVFPVQGLEKGQSAASSEEHLMWHTEHSDKKTIPDWLALFCLRNPGDIGTLVSRPRIENLPDKTRDALCDANNFQFSIGNLPQTTPILEKDEVSNETFLKIDSVYIKPLNGLARKALQQVFQEIEKATVVAPQVPGYITLIPNRFTVHSRGTFQAQYDGNDRWLIRCFIACRNLPMQSRLIE